MKEFILTAKKQLTHDVFELQYSSEASMDHTPWQFITFVLPNGIGGRSYSILSSNKNKCTLIIKRVLEGKWGSKYLCDAKVWEIFKGVGPVWKFVLHPEKNAKLFAGTGTGIVPLYNQVVSTLEWGNKSSICLLFWVRTQEDLFYVENMQALQNKYTNFDYKIALSREETQDYFQGYITQFVDSSIQKEFDEVYLCWAPVVVDSMFEALEKKSFDVKKVYTEKY